MNVRNDSDNDFHYAGQGFHVGSVVELSDHILNDPDRMDHIRRHCVEVKPKPKSKAKPVAAPAPEVAASSDSAERTTSNRERIEGANRSRRRPARGANREVRKPSKED